MKKKLLLISGVILVLIGFGGIWGYNKYFRLNPVIQKQLQNQFGTDFFNIALPKEITGSNAADNGKTDSDQTRQSDIRENSQSHTATEQDAEKTLTSTFGNASTSAKGVTQDEIIKKYTPQFGYLQNLALSRLNALYAAAVQEYKQGEKSGTLNRSALAEKYIQAGNMLEASVDNQFYRTLDAMQAELIANHLSTDIINAEKNEYEKAKSAERFQLLSKARK
ncbi:hypothetical protein DEAC_c06590 [Desulfosporosinus acididurans]|uniref:Uncharacterized protein n=1 Tax=Desulfosporosinus acididurans TaxID=476652 RepID=A0A0J1FVW2_9FIRM|nr:hypothetical protein [Desulfosporosinus acididurans]KLU67447.1 hypothetical protein DEAC_c06590 [Desulfosporosinus acididurans]